MTWFDPAEGDPDQWREVDEVRRGDEIRLTYERAVAARLPYDRRVELRGSKEVVEEAYPDSDYDFVRVQCYEAIDTDGRLKLNERGILWGDDEYRRFRGHYRRPGEPTDTRPFEEYTYWTRSTTGSVTREDGSPSFEEPDDEPTEETIDRTWADCSPFHQVLLAELELVRNPPYARAILEDRERWEEIDAVFRYLLHAFDSPP